MRAVTIKAAKAHLDELLSDEQAARLWRQLADDEASGRTDLFDSAAKAAARLRRPKARRRAPPASRRR